MKKVIVLDGRNCLNKRFVIKIKHEGIEILIWRGYQ